MTRRISNLPIFYLAMDATDDDSRDAQPVIDPSASSGNERDARTRSAEPSDAEVLRALMGALKPPARPDEPPLGSKAAAGSARRRRLGGGMCAPTRGARAARCAL